MSDPSPLRLSAAEDERELAALVRAARDAERLGAGPTGAGRRRFAAAVAHEAHARVVRRTGAAALVGLAAALALVLHPLSRGSRPGAPERATPAGAPTPAAAVVRYDVLELAEVGTFEVSQGTAGLALEGSGRSLSLAAGLLRAMVLPQHPKRPVVITTPHLRVVVVGTRFDVQVDPAFTSVNVLEGLVRVEAGPAVAYVGGGESIRSDDARLAPPVPSARPATAPRALPTFKTARRPPSPPPPQPTVVDCGHLADRRGRVDCYEALARGSGLAAQNALFTLGREARENDGRPDRALEFWRQYERRFPGGVLGPEVALGIFELARQAGDADQTLAAARAFEARYWDDPRADRVGLDCAALLCRTGRRSEAEPLLSSLERSRDARTRGAAADLRARCGSALDSSPPRP